jgi:hypothetical protein
MTGQSEEITVFPYQIYQALTDQHIRDVQANARRHERTTAAQLAQADPTQHPSRRRNAVTHLLALVRVRACAGATSATTSAPPGPMGCVV